jgi:hypothetical protein
MAEAMVRLQMALTRLRLAMALALVPAWLHEATLEAWKDAADDVMRGYK